MRGVTDPPATPQSSRLAAIVAVLAALGGVVLVLVGFGRLVGSIEIGGSPGTSAFVTTPTTVSTSMVVPSTVTTTTDTGIDPFVTVVDESGRLSVDFPEEWTDTSGGGWSVDDRVVGLSVSAAIDRDAWYSGWGTPGAFLGVSEVPLDEFTPELGDFASVCRLADAGGREYPGHTTVVQEWVDCGDEGSQFTTALIWPTNFGGSALLQVVTLDGTATALVDHAVATLSYSP
jgi:hypothetical protein